MKRSTPSHGPARLLIVPGLRDSGPAHWQSWLQSLNRQSVRVVQDDWDTPDLDRWAERVAETLQSPPHGHGDGPWVVAAHSFGCLAVARHLVRRPDLPMAAALFVAPADPDKFDVAAHLPQAPLPIHSTLVASTTDPWMRPPTARHWADRWGSHWIDLGDAGHINAESGFGPLPLAQHWVRTTTQRLARNRRSERASPAEWSFAI